MKIKNSGLLPTPYDERDLTLGAITELPKLTELPSNFILDGIEIKNQGKTDFCTQFAACGMSELQEGVSLSPEWCFAKTKELNGGVDSYGQDLRQALDTHRKIGAVEAKDVPYSVATKDKDFLRRIENYPRELAMGAIQHMKQSYLKVTGPYDAFDNIRATVWKYRAEKRGVAMGCIFGWDTDDVILDTVPTSGGGHAMYYAGWKTIKGEEYLVLVNSYGKNAGENGIHYVSRDVVNHFEAQYGAYMFSDLTPEQVRYMIENGITDRDNWIIQLYKSIITLLQQLLLLKKKQK